MDKVIDLLRVIPLWQLALIFLFENVVIFLLVVGLGHFIKQRFNNRPVCLEPGPVDTAEISLAVSTVVLNTLVTFIGLVLWRKGIINFRTDTGLKSLLDIPILL